MSKKKKCTSCENYFVSDSKNLNNYCSNDCIKKAFTKKNTKSVSKRKKKEKTPRQIAKEEAWAQFSIFIRKRDCIRFTGDPDQGMCVTCKQPFPFSKLQAGHFISGRGNAVLFDETCVFSQCYQCNGNPPYGRGGNYVEYFVFMEQEFGREYIDVLRKKKGTTVKYKLADFIAIKELYENKTQELLNETRH